MQTDTVPVLGPVIAAAERALSEAWGVAVDLLPLNAAQAVRPHSTVARCLVRGSTDVAPVTVIVKAAGDYDSSAVSPQSPAGRMLNELAALRLLAGVRSDLAPRVLTADREHGLLVLEDLGSGPSLQDVLDSGTQADARHALNAYAAGLGQLHALTLDRLTDLQTIRRDLGITSPAADPFVTHWPAHNLPPLAGVLADIGCGWTNEAQRELDAVVAAMAEPGQFLALSQGDTCPENHRLATSSSSSSSSTAPAVGPTSSPSSANSTSSSRLTVSPVRFLDFEFGGFRHALLDAAFLRLPFPTCQHVRRLPVDVVIAAEQAYRRELAAACPAALDDAVFARGMLHAHAWWTMLSLGAYLRPALAADRQVGTTTMRQRLVLWLDTFVSGAESLPALHGVASDLLATLRMRWGAEAASPPFAAFWS